MNGIGISALQLERNLQHLDVYRYRLTIPTASEDDDPVALTRRAVNNLSYANRVAMTSLGDYVALSLQPINQMHHSWQGIECSAKELDTITLDASLPHHREAIQKLVNECLMQGARELSRFSKQGIEAKWSIGHYVQIIDKTPSSRVPIRADYLNAYQTVTLTPSVLPNGDVLVGVSIRHSLVPPENINMDWIIQHRPEWVRHIDKVRHRYSNAGKPPAVADLLGVADNLTTDHMIPLPQGDISLFDYHVKQGNVSPQDNEAVKGSAVLRVTYGGVIYGGKPKGKELQHIAALLQPMFSFDLLSKVDSYLLNSIARILKWPIKDRLETSWTMIKGLKLGELQSRLKVPGSASLEMVNIKPPIRLAFGNGRYGATESQVDRNRAYAPMKIKTVVPIIMSSNEVLASTGVKHTQQVKQKCLSWVDGSVAGQTRWVRPISLSGPDELNARLSKNPPQDAMLLIAIGQGEEKSKIRDVAFRYGLPAQFMRLDHPQRTYSSHYYGNLSAGVFSKGGGILSAIQDMPGEADLFIGLDLGGIRQRAPGTAFLFTRDGSQLGWQLTDVQPGERVEDRVLMELLERSLESYVQASGGTLPRGIVLHRDGKLYESLEVIKDFEAKAMVKVDALEVLKSGAPQLYRREDNPYYVKDGDQPRRFYRNPEVGDAVILKGLDEMILSTYSGKELGKMDGQATVRPLRLRKRYGDTPLEVLAQQVILLSRIHGASLYRHPRLPVTTHHADRFATLRQECNVDDLSKMSRFCPVYL